MMRPRSGDSDIDEPSEDTLLEAELSRMQRSYRVMQNDYKAYREETKRIINRQKSLIKALERERLELDTQMAKMETTQNQKSDNQNARRLAELARAEKDYLQEVKEEREAIKELKNKIAYVEKKIGSQRQKMGGVQNGTIKTIATHKKKAVLENRLDKAMVHFNKQLAVNRSMREDIEHLRRERSVFDNLYKKLAKELENAKTEMKDIIEASTQTFEQRDEAQNKMVALRERSEKDQQQHITEVRDLERVIRHDDKVKEFMNIKNNDRADYITEEMAKRKKNRADDKGINAEIETIRIHEEAFNRIKEVTGDDDIELIVDDFIRNEEENFALFNYVNELNSEVEMVQEEVGVIKKDIAQYKKEDKECDNKRDNLMRSLEKKYTQTSYETSRAEERLKESNKVLDELRVGIHTMFKRLGCDPRPIREMLGGEDGVTNKNMMIYLGQIEHKTTELLNMLQYSKMKRAEIMGQTPSKSESETARPTVDGLHIQLSGPSTWEDLDSEEEAEEEPRPLSEAELRDRVMRQLQRRTHTPQRSVDTGQKNAETPTGKEKKKSKKSQQIKVK